MNKTNTKTFGNLSVSLETLADGIKSHASDEEFPKGLLSEDVIRGHRNELEDLRETFEKLSTQARQAFEKYESKARKVKGVISSARSALHASYGKRNSVLPDFGFKPLKNSKPKRPAAEIPAANAA
ncbi:MAG: hypothetical protein FJ088_02185 [Deltaproteobacteria bacterium]|nr:hypothetical protein [Deltaproteobacteria bacterium]